MYPLHAIVYIIIDNINISVEYQNKDNLIVVHIVQCYLYHIHNLIL